MHALDPHEVPFAGAQRADQITQALLLATMANHPGHGRRAAAGTVGAAADIRHAALGQGQQRLAPGGLQGGAEEGHNGGVERRVVAVQQAHGPVAALCGIGLAQAVQHLGDGVVRCLDALQQGVEEGLPAILAHQAVHGQRRHLVGAGLGQALWRRQQRGGWIVHHLLLGLAKAGQQAQVVAHGMIRRQFLQAFGAQGEQARGRPFAVGRGTGRSADLLRFHKSVSHRFGLLKKRARPQGSRSRRCNGLNQSCLRSVTSRYQSSWCLRAQRWLTLPESMAPKEPLIQIAA